jgi:hypothetical protein
MLRTASSLSEVTGSFASTFYGEPRMTRDIDLVIDPTASSVEVFVNQFDSEGFYIDDAVAAVARRDMFNLIDSKSGWKVALIIRKDRPYSEVEFARRRPATIAGVSLWKSWRPRESAAKRRSL